jgi:hypothetical protein
MDEDVTIAVAVTGIIAGIAIVCSVCALNFRRTSIQDYIAIIP